MVRSHILVCGGTGCTSSGSLKLIDSLNAEITLKENKTKRLKISKKHLKRK